MACYTSDMKQVWHKTGLFKVTEQCLADQATMIMVNGWLTDVEIEEITRKCTEDSHVHENDQRDIKNQTEKQNNENQMTKR